VGKTKDVISTSGASPNFLIYGPQGGGGTAFGAYQSIGFGATTGAVHLPVANGGYWRPQAEPRRGYPWRV
jgi:hypothetical protein